MSYKNFNLIRIILLSGILLLTSQTTNASDLNEPAARNSGSEVNSVDKHHHHRHRHKGRTVIYVEPVIIYSFPQGSSISTGNGYDYLSNAPIEKKRKEYVPANVLIEDYEEIFNYALENTPDSNTAEILPELFNAHTARIIYEASFTGEFSEIIARDYPNDTKERFKLLQTARKIAAENYWHYLTDFKEAKKEDIQINNKLRQALKKGAAAKLQSDKKIFGKSNFNSSGDYLLKMLACAAVNPQTGSVMNPAIIYAGDWQVPQDSRSEKAVELLNEIAGINESADANETQEPNSF